MNLREGAALAATIAGLHAVANDLRALYAQIIGAALVPEGLRAAARAGIATIDRVAPSLVAAHDVARDVARADGGA